MRPAAPEIGTVKIVSAARDLAAGVPLTAQDLAIIEWPQNLVLPGSLEKTEDAVGRPLRVSLSAKQPLMQKDLAAAGSGFGLAGKIPTGMRATAVRSNEIVGVAGFLYPGSHVDVVTTFNFSGQTVTQTVLQNVEVLSTGTATEPDPQGKPQTVNVVTLLLTPEDSQKMLLASSQGTIQFVLRSGVDEENVNLAPTRIEQLSASYTPPPAPVIETPASRPEPRRPAPKVEQPPPPPPVVEAPKPPEPHIIEVIQGTQRTTQKF